MQFMSSGSAMLSCQYFVKDEAMPLTLSWLGGREGNSDPAVVSRWVGGIQECCRGGVVEGGGEDAVAVRREILDSAAQRS